jgi:molybdenum cofactor cytidylyltransferase
VKVGAVVLAAGGSSRFGQPKQLLVCAGETLVRRAARAALTARGPVVVVVGRDGKEIAEELLGLPVTVVPNDNWERGIGSSLRCGIEALPECDAVVILTCDQPRVDGAAIQRLIQMHEKTRNLIVASAYAGTIGVPALFAGGIFDELRRLPDDQGAKPIIAAQPERVATIDFPEGAIDIDNAKDWENFCRTPNA